MNQGVRTVSGSRPTMRDIAAAAGVSTAAVSYVLAGQTTKVSAATRERVLAAAQELRYQPNRVARAMRTGRTGIVQLSLHMLADPWSLAVADAVNEAALEQDLAALILADGDWYQALTRVQADVAFIDSPEPTAGSREHLAELVGNGQRLVVFSDDLQPDGFDVVRSDPLPGAELVLAHLLERTTSIACLTHSRLREGHQLGQRTRFSVYAELVDAGRITESRVAAYEESQAHAFRAALDLLRHDDPPEALYCTTDFAALAAIQAAQFLGIDVPGTMIVTGLGNTPAGLTSSPTLTTAGPLDFYRDLARILVEAAGHPVSGRGTLHSFSWELVARESTAR